MNILLTNDDGINAPGLHALAYALSSVGTVWVCAPRQEQSASSHGLTVRHELPVYEAPMDSVEKAWCVEGKPADCVKLVFIELLQAPIDLVVSGINDGANCGTDTLYSGTVAGALEGAANGAAAMAISLSHTGASKAQAGFASAAEIALLLVKQWEAGLLPIPPMSILNVNIPDLPREQRRGFKLTRLGIQHYSDAYEKIEETKAYTAYHLRGERIPTAETDAGLDIVAVAEGYVTLTPISVDRTDFALLGELEKRWKIP